MLQHALFSVEVSITLSAFGLALMQHLCENRVD